MAKITLYGANTKDALAFLKEKAKEKGLKDVAEVTGDHHQVEISGDPEVIRTFLKSFPDRYLADDDNGTKNWTGTENWTPKQDSLHKTKVKVLDQDRKPGTNQDFYYVTDEQLKEFDKKYPSSGATAKPASANEAVRLYLEGISSKPLVDSKCFKEMGLTAPATSGVDKTKIDLTFTVAEAKKFAVTLEALFTPSFVIYGTKEKQPFKSYFTMGGIFMLKGLMTDYQLSKDPNKNIVLEAPYFTPEQKLAIGAALEEVGYDIDEFSKKLANDGVLLFDADFTPKTLDDVCYIRSEGNETILGYLKEIQAQMFPGLTTIMPAKFKESKGYLLVLNKEGRVTLHPFKEGEALPADFKYPDPKSKEDVEKIHEYMKQNPTLNGEKVEYRRTNIGDTLGVPVLIVKGNKADARADAQQGSGAEKKGGKNGKPASPAGGKSPDTPFVDHD